VALLMRSSLVPDEFARWSVGRFAHLGRTRLVIKLRQNNFYRMEHSVTFALMCGLWWLSLGQRGGVFVAGDACGGLRWP